jgi:hypothetical protein
MSITTKNVLAILRDSKMRDNLLRDEDLTEQDYKSFDSLDQEKMDIASDNVVSTLESYAPFQISYPSPIDQYPDDAQVYGTRGFYMVRTQDDTYFFTTKRAALRFAESSSKVSWKIAREMGYFKDNE